MHKCEQDVCRLVFGPSVPPHLHITLLQDNCTYGGQNIESPPPPPALPLPPSLIVVAACLVLL